MFEFIRNKLGKNKPESEALRRIAENKQTKNKLLTLSNCQDLTSLPEEISDFLWLQQLDISHSDITDLTPLSTLLNLQWLRVLHTQITELTPLTGLVNLQQLYISRTPVTDLTPLAGLVNLQQLDVSRTPVTDLTPLAELVNLQQLDILNTSITDLTPLAGLLSLQQLDVSNTKISDLKPLSALLNLQQLDISNTHVTDLAPLAELVNLQQVSVCNTSVTDFSPLSKLLNLQRLDISNTKMTNLTSLVPLMRRGLTVKWKNYDGENGIYVKDCPFTHPPAEIVRQGNTAILNYLSETTVQGFDQLYEAKLLIVGEGGAGKTSLLRRLYQPEAPLPDEEESTKGIAIYQHNFTLDNGREFRLNVWDFGGQEIYHATHQFFLTKRSLYILLDDTRKNDKNIHDPIFKYWLEVVDLLGDHSPVLIFQNEKSGRSKAIDKSGIQSRFPNVKEFHRGDLQQVDSVQPLRHVIEHYAQNLPHIGEQLPSQWVRIRADLEQCAQYYPTITQQEYFDIYEHHLEFDRDKALHLSRYLHDLGVFLHFQDEPLLANVVILQNTWATEAVFKILDDEIVKAESGYFTSADCKRVWQDSVYTDMHTELLALMQQFELCYHLPDEDMWLVPRLLKPSKPEALKAGRSGDLLLRYHYAFLPKGMINRLMVRLHRYVHHPDMAWDNGVLFEYADTSVLVDIAPLGNEIILRARGTKRRELLRIIATDLEALNDTFRGLQEKVEKLVPCFCKNCRMLEEPHFYNYAKLKEKFSNQKYTIDCEKVPYATVDILELINNIDG